MERKTGIEPATVSLIKMYLSIFRHNDLYSTFRQNALTAELLAHKLAVLLGLEPRTYWLTASCTAIVLQHNK